jgi:hypothetical protein
MTEPASHPDSAAPHTEFAIVIDGELAVVPHADVSFEEVCSIAFPDVDDPEVQYKVTYENAAGPHPEGILRPDETVKAKPTGTGFHVSHAGKS